MTEKGASLVTLEGNRQIEVGREPPFHSIGMITCTSLRAPSISGFLPRRS